jgi:DNA-directed RNA polymerase II subunit RPB2
VIGDYYENSSELTSIIKVNNAIESHIVSQKMYKKGTEIALPFYVFYRALGMTSDKDMLESILLGTKNEHVTRQVHAAFYAEYHEDFSNLQYQYDPTENILEIAKNTDNYGQYFKNGVIIGKDEQQRTENRKLVVRELTKILDDYFLPHMGQGPQYRVAKLRYYGMMLHRLVLVRLGMVAQTDRDNYANRSVHTSGRGISNIIKTNFSYSVVNAITASLRRVLKQKVRYDGISFQNVVSNALSSNNFESQLLKAMTQSEMTNTVGNVQIKNRLSSQQMHLKTLLNKVCNLRLINSSGNDPNKVSKRALDRRQVAMTAQGFIDPLHSPDTGMKVGIQKQMSIGAKVTGITVSFVIREMLAADELIVPLEKVSSNSIAAFTRSMIFFNGQWLGVTDSPVEFTKKYRTKRMNGEIDKYTSIYWEKLYNTISIRVDSGRIVHPMLVVYSNYDDIVEDLRKKRKPRTLKQDIKITEQQLFGLRTGKVTLDDLQRAGIIEYVTPEEKGTLLVAPDIKTFVRNNDNIKYAYTHVEIPEMSYGLASLTSPLAHHNQPARVCFQTNQVRQMCEWVRVNWRFFPVKGMFIQYWNEYPLVQTIIARLLPPTGMNAMLAVMIYGGFNQEDSLIFNASSVRRGMYTGSYFGVATTERENNERFVQPNIAVINSEYNYGKLDDYVVPVGTELVNGDVIIAKTTHNKDGTMIDNSVVYKSLESAVVEKVHQGINAAGKSIIKVLYRTNRPVGIGDKFSSRAGQKGVCGALYEQCDMPFTEDGLTPDIIINPHAIPSRMTIGVLIEGLMAELCAIKGAVIDQTMFDSIDMDSIYTELRKLGCVEDGMKTMYNGFTGEKLDVKIFLVPNVYQRLQKFVNNSVYAISSGRMCATTRQPVSGKGSGGSLRLGEMEKECVYSNGAVDFLAEKFTKHSDNFSIFGCATCGNFATVVVTKRSGAKKCTLCKDQANIVRLPSAWMNKTFLQYLRSSNLNVNLEFEKPCL